MMEAHKLQTCPYNESHRVEGARFVVHLVRCRQTYGPKFPLKTCPLNAEHKIPAPELEYHLLTCPDRTLIDKELYTSSSRTKAPIAVTAAPKIPDEEECWDDMNTPAYNPLEYTEKHKIITFQKGAPPAIRKINREKQRRRNRELANQEELSTSQLRKDMRKFDNKADASWGQALHESSRQDVTKFVGATNLEIVEQMEKLKVSDEPKSTYSKVLEQNTEVERRPEKENKAVLTEWTKVKSKGKKKHN